MSVQPWHATVCCLGFPAISLSTNLCYADLVKTWSSRLRLRLERKDQSRRHIPPHSTSLWAEALICHQTEYITWRSFCCCWGYRRLGRFGELALTHLISSAPRSVRGWAKDCVRTEPKNCPHQLRDSQKLTSFRSFWLWENLFCGSVAPDLLEHSFPKNPARLPSTFFFQFWEAIPATKSRRETALHGLPRRLRLQKLPSRSLT